MDEKFYGKCRCCLAEGLHRDAKREYFLNGIREVYYDMFVSCFNLHLGHNSKDTLICLYCIQQLRDASTFRARVLESENKLIKGFTCNNTLFLEVSPMQLKRKDPIKLEMPLVEVKEEPDLEDNKSLLLFNETRSDTDSEHESGAPGPPTKKKLRTEIVHKCVTTYSTQDVKPSEVQSTDNESRRASPSQIIGDTVMEHDKNKMENDDENPTIDHVQKPRQSIGVGLNKPPKTSAERGREFRARKALLKQQKEPAAVVEIATEGIRSAGPSEENQAPGPSKMRTIEKRAKSAEATRRWRERKKGVKESSKRPAKTAAQRMREYRERKKS